MQSLRQLKAITLKANRLLKASKTANNCKFKSNFDAQGSYTGVDAFDKYEKPVQDADDL